jgi:hypothetical protein
MRTKIRAAVDMDNLDMTKRTILLSTQQAAAKAGVSLVTLRRAVSIWFGNRHTFGHARMPGLAVQIDPMDRRVQWVSKVDLASWMAARAKLNGAGFKKKKKIGQLNSRRNGDEARDVLK